MAGELGQGCMNVSGVLRTPTMSAREKLSVARELRNMPRRRREKERMSWYCWAVGA